MSLPNNFSSTLIAGTDQANTIATRVMNLQAIVSDIIGAPLGTTINAPVVTYDNSTGLVKNISLSGGTELAGINFTDSDESDTWRITVNGGENDTDPRLVIQHLVGSSWVDVLEVAEGYLWHKFLQEIGTGTDGGGGTAGVSSINTPAIGGLYGGGTGALTMGIGTAGITHAMLSNDCVDYNNLADNCVRGAHIYPAQVQTTHIAANNVTAAKISGGGTAGQILTSTGTGSTWATPGAAERHYDLYDWSGATGFFTDNALGAFSYWPSSTHTAGDGKCSVVGSSYPSRLSLSGKVGTWKITAYGEWDVPASAPPEGPTALVLTHHKTGWDVVDTRVVAWSPDYTTAQLNSFTGLGGQNVQSATATMVVKVASGDATKHIELFSYHKASSAGQGRKLERVQLTAEWLGE